MRRLPLISHRGRVAQEKGNLISHIKDALKYPISGLEVDVRITKDDKVIVYHDKKVRGKSVKDLTYKELKSLSRINIPLLEDVIKIVRGKTIFIIELKTNPIEPVLDIIKGYKVKDVIIVSFWMKLLNKVREINPKIPLGKIYMKGFFPVRQVVRNKLHYIVPYYKMITKSLVKKSHKNNIKVIVWSVNDKSTAEELLSMGVDGIVTDNVKRLQNIKC